MHSGKIVFAQIMEHLPLRDFHRCVDRYQGHHKVQSFSCLDQFLSMAFAQLTYRESLRDIEVCLRAQQTFISITDGKVHDVNVLDEIYPEAGSFYVMDRGYLDFERLYVLAQVLSVTAFEKMPILHALEGGHYRTQESGTDNQLNLFD